MEIKVKHFFDAGHKLSDSEELVTKQCNNFHGHTYYCIVTARAKISNYGMVVDFSGIKNIIDEFDHTMILRDLPQNRSMEILAKPRKPWVFLDSEPTAENIAIQILNKITHKYSYLKNICVQLGEGFKGEKTNWVSTNSTLYNQSL